jgi:hypothetical protein
MACPDLRTVDGLDAPYKFCTFGAPWTTAQHHGFFWGDSHAEHYAPLLDLVGRELITYKIFRTFRIDGFFIQ